MAGTCTAKGGLDAVAAAASCGVSATRAGKEDPGPTPKVCGAVTCVTGSGQGSAVTVPAVYTLESRQCLKLIWGLG